MSNCILGPRRNCSSIRKNLRPSSPGWRTVNQCLNGSPASSLKLDGSQNGAKLELAYQVTGKSDEDQLVIAVVQKNAIHRISRGENEGRTLSHTQIVRSVQAFPIGRGEIGKVTVRLPKDYNAYGWEVIGLLQGKETLAIHGATRAALSSTKLSYQK